MKNTAIFLLCFPALRAACLRTDRSRSRSPVPLTLEDKAKAEEEKAKAEDEKLVEMAKAEEEKAKAEEEKAKAEEEKAKAEDEKLDEMVKAFSEADKFAAEENKREPTGQCEKGLTGEKGWKVTYHPAKDGKDAMWVLSFGHRGELGWSKTSAGEWNLDYKGMKNEGLQLAFDLLNALKKKKPKCLCLHLPPDVETLEMEYQDAKDKAIDEMGKAFSEADAFAKKTEGGEVVRQNLPKGTEYYPAEDGKDAMLVLSHDGVELKWSKKSGEWKLFDYEEVEVKMKEAVITLLKNLISALRKREVEAKCLPLYFEPNDKVADEMAKDYLKADDLVARILAGKKFTPKKLKRGRVEYYPSDVAQPRRVYLFFSPYGSLAWTCSEQSQKCEFKSLKVDVGKLVSALGPKVKKAKYLRLPNPKK